MAGNERKDGIQARSTGEAVASGIATIKAIGDVVTRSLTGVAAGAAIGAALGTLFFPVPVGTVLGAFLIGGLNAYLKIHEKNHVCADLALRRHNQSPFVDDIPIV
jgi:hypothetical protein